MPRNRFFQDPSVSIAELDKPGYASMVTIHSYYFGDPTEREPEHIALEIPVIGLYFSFRDERPKREVTRWHTRAEDVGLYSTSVQHYLFTLEPLLMREKFLEKKGPRAEICDCCYIQLMCDLLQAGGFSQLVGRMPAEVKSYNAFQQSIIQACDNERKEIPASRHWDNHVRDYMRDAAHVYGHLIKPIGSLQVTLEDKQFPSRRALKKEEQDGIFPAVVSSLLLLFLVYHYFTKTQENNAGVDAQPALNFTP